MKKGKEVPILLQDGTPVEEGKKYFRVVKKSVLNPRYSSRKELLEREIMGGSGNLSTAIHEDTCIRVQDGFNCRVFVLRDKSGIERNFSVQSTSRHDPTQLLFGSKKGANAYCKEKNSEDLKWVSDKLKKHEALFKKYKECERKLKSNISKLK